MPSPSSSRSSRSRVSRALPFALALPVLLAGAPAPAAPAASAPVDTGPFRPDAEGFIRDWLVLAPIFYEPLWPAGEEELDRQTIAGEGGLRPKAGDAVTALGHRTAWTAVKTDSFGLDLAVATGTKETRYRLAYAVTYVVADAAHKGARLRLGTNDLAKVYWNGKPVLRSLALRALEKDQSAALVDIKKGVNVLVTKIANDETHWGVAARLVDEKGAPISGLAIATAPDGSGAVAPDAEGFARHWLVAGPFEYKPRPYARGQLDRKQVPNEERLAPRPGQTTWVNTGGIPWTAHKAKDYFLDLDAFQKTMRKYVPPARIEGNDTLFTVLGYAVAYIHAPREMPGLIAKIGANDHGKLYVNEKVVAVKTEAGKLERDAASGKVSLKKGLNTVVFKLVNAGDFWSGCLRFVDEDGKPVTDLEVRTAPPPTAEMRLLARE
jgi:hypothetical protein